MNILIGILGFFLGLLLFSSGLAAGWKLRSRLPDVSAEAISAARERQLQEEQQAFRTLQNYSAERAYGMEEGGLRS